MTRAVLVAVGLVLAFAGCRSADAKEAWMSEPAPAIEGLAVRRGAPFHLSDERGKVVLLSFGYTSCAEICPATFATVKNVLRELGPSAAEVQFVYVSVDPERDTPPVFAPFLASVDPRFEGVFAEGKTLSKMLSAYGVVVRKRVPDPARYARRNIDPSAFYSMDHTSAFWGIDRRGKLRFRQGHEATASEILAATKKLLAEPS